MFAFIQVKRVRALWQCFSCALSIFFVFSALSPSLAMAQSVGAFSLPLPGAMVHPSVGFVPVLIKGMTLDPQNPMKFDFIVDSGNTGFTADQVKDESARLVKYFLASMTIPKDDLWVNLSPHEQNRIIPKELSKTSLGRDLLSQDYLLKQLTATLVNPQQDLGKKFWDRVRQESKRRFGAKDIPTELFNKVWIMPESATVYEHAQTVYIVESKLKVLTDQDYQSKNQEKVENDLLSMITKEVIIPAIEEEVNTGENFAPLRQIYHSLILAKWYKETIKHSFLAQSYVDQGNVAGVELVDQNFKQDIYDQYMAAYKKGVFNLIQEDYDTLSQEAIPRKYFSGGILEGNYQIQNYSDDQALLSIKPVGDNFNVQVNMAVDLADQVMIADSQLTKDAIVDAYLQELAHADTESILTLMFNLTDLSVDEKRILTALSKTTEFLLEKRDQLLDEIEVIFDSTMNPRLNSPEGLDDKYLEKLRVDLADKFAENIVSLLMEVQRIEFGVKLIEGFLIYGLPVLTVSGVKKSDQAMISRRAIMTMVVLLFTSLFMPDFPFVHQQAYAMINPRASVLQIPVESSAFSKAAFELSSGLERLASDGGEGFRQMYHSDEVYEYIGYLYDKSISMMVNNSYMSAKSFVDIARLTPYSVDLRIAMGQGIKVTSKYKNHLKAVLKSFKDSQTSDRRNYIFRFYAGENDYFLETNDGDLGIYSFLEVMANQGPALAEFLPDLEIMFQRETKPFNQIALMRTMVMIGQDYGRVRNILLAAKKRFTDKKLIAQADSALELLSYLVTKGHTSTVEKYGIQYQHGKFFHILKGKKIIELFEFYNPRMGEEKDPAMLTISVDALAPQVILLYMAAIDKGEDTTVITAFDNAMVAQEERLHDANKMIDTYKLIKDDSKLMGALMVIAEIDGVDQAFVRFEELESRKAAVYLALAQYVKDYYELIVDPKKMKELIQTPGFRDDLNMIHQAVLLMNEIIKDKEFINQFIVGQGSVDQAMVAMPFEQNVKNELLILKNAKHYDEGRLMETITYLSQEEALGDDETFRLQTLLARDHMELRQVVEAALRDEDILAGYVHVIKNIEADVSISVVKKLIELGIDKRELLKILLDRQIILDGIVKHIAINTDAREQKIAEVIAEGQNVQLLYVQKSIKTGSMDASIEFKAVEVQAALRKYQKKLHKINVIIESNMIDIDYELQMTMAGDQAMITSSMEVLPSLIDESAQDQDFVKGGIDMNEIEMKREGGGLNLHFDTPAIESAISAQILGVTPVIINVVPISNLFLLLGLTQPEEDGDVKLSKTHVCADPPKAEMKLTANRKSQFPLLL